ncbi:hypothetical protein J19TS2_63220 [Cohnella xylanilytica]|nr:hypothetical protein J19TS2_63220 [Cohnella xylanilytica]
MYVNPSGLISCDLASQSTILPSLSNATNGSNTLSMANALFAVIWLCRSSEVTEAGRA